MGLPRAEVARIRTAAAIHDVGKIETPKAILHKAGRLTDEEYEVIKQPSRAMRALDGRGAARSRADIDGPPPSRAPRRHRVSGPPIRQEIPLGARIIAVADTFDAITSERTYRSCKPAQEGDRHPQGGGGHAA
jgi:response regulator RpfG family c-di-GMP phosphodiesterase